MIEEGAAAFTPPSAAATASSSSASRLQYKLHPSYIAMRTQLLVTTETRRQFLQEEQESKKSKKKSKQQQQRDDADEDEPNLIDKLIPPHSVPREVKAPNNTTLMGFDMLHNDNSYYPTIFPSHLYPLSSIYRQDAASMEELELLSAQDAAAAATGDADEVPAAGAAAAGEQQENIDLANVNLRGGCYLIYRGPSAIDTTTTTTSTSRQQQQQQQSSSSTSSKRYTKWFYFLSILMLLVMAIDVLISFFVIFIEPYYLALFKNNTTSNNAGSANYSTYYYLRRIVVDPLEMLSTVSGSLIGLMGVLRKNARYLTFYIVFLQIIFVVEMIQLNSLSKVTMKFCSLVSLNILAMTLRKSLLYEWFTTPSL